MEKYARDMTDPFDPFSKGSPSPILASISDLIFRPPHVVADSCTLTIRQIVLRSRIIFSRIVNVLLKYFPSKSFRRFYRPIPTNYYPEIHFAGVFFYFLANYRSSF